MPYRFAWLLESRVALSVISGSVTLENLEAYTQQFIDDYLSDGQAPVHHIVDVREMHQFPTSLIKLKTVTEPMLRHPKLGVVVVISNNILVNFIATALTKVWQINCRLVTSREDAAEILKKSDPTLNQLL